MKKRSLCSRILSLLLALTMLLMLCGCSRDPGGDSPSEAAGEAVATPADTPKATVSAEDADKYMHNDAAISAHVAHNQKVNPQTNPGRTADEFHIYISNTETMEGFVGGKQVTAYRDGVQGAFDAAATYKNQYIHSLKRQGSTGLYWGEAQPLDDLARLNTLTPDFYMGNVLPMDGTLSPLFRGGTPFGENSLTLMVSNFVEPGFEFNSLQSGITQYFDNYEKSAACIVGITSQFQGTFHVPNYNSSDRSTFYIKNFSGNVPYYMVIVGPEGDVESYTERLFQHLDNRDVSYAYEHYSNSVHEEVFAQPLMFDVIPDRKFQTNLLPVVGSYNTGNLTEHAAGNAYFATYSGLETRDAATSDGEGVLISSSSQISLISRNYDGVSDYAEEHMLYVYDKTTGQWKDAGKNAQLKVAVEVEPKDGPLNDEERRISRNKNRDQEDQSEVISSFPVLSANREEMYVRVQLDFGAEGGEILSREEIYRLEMKLHLNQETPDRNNGANGSGLSDMSITNNDYFKCLNADHLVIYSQNGDFIWTGLMDIEDRDNAADALEKTPNLDALLLSLRKLEDKYETHTEMYTYLDFVFNIADKGGSRKGRRG